MAETRDAPFDGTQIVVTPGSDLDATLSRLEAEGGFVELVHGESRYQLVPITGDIDVRRAWRRLLAARTRAFRDRQPPLGLTTAQLVREARGDCRDD